MVLNGIGLTQYAAAELSLAEKGIASAKVILTGFVVVFSVLLLLIGVIKLYSFIVGKAQGTGKNLPQRKWLRLRFPNLLLRKRYLPQRKGFPRRLSPLLRLLSRQFTANQAGQK